jgi:RNA polymerase sigma factor (sigma-70 family)
VVVSYRHQQYHRFYSEEEINHIKYLDPQEAAIKFQKAEIIQVFVDKLPVKYQKLVRLRYFLELSYEEIAEELDAPLGTVKAQLHRARELMYEMVKNKRDHI